MHDAGNQTQVSQTLSELWAQIEASGALRRLLELARDEDLGPGGEPGDITSLLTDDEQVEAYLRSRSSGRLSGAWCVGPVLSVLAPEARGVRVSPHIDDGSKINPGDVIVTIAGPRRAVLAAERTMLNLVGRLSGIATRTAAFVRELNGLPTRLLDTRKTTPGLRVLEKYAVRCGGGFSHRMGLYDAVLLKDNHIAGIPVDRLAQAVTDMSQRARTLAAERGAKLSFIELEVDTLSQLQAVLKAGGCGVDIVLLDNMEPSALRKAVDMRNASGTGILLEASGGVTLENLRALAETGIDRISVGGLTHQAVSLDVGLDL